MKYHFKVDKEESGFSAECVELPGCITQGDTMNDLRENAQDALQAYIDEPAGSDYMHPLPNPALSKKRLMEVSVPADVAFAFILRHFRLSKQLPVAAAAKLFNRD